ncbi:MAG: peptidase M14 [Planctomycetes bacterium]|nr:peptidase M14 [Planctomycetota bacterium]
MIQFLAATLMALQGGFPGTPTGSRPTVEIAWNRLYDEPEIHAHFARLEAAWPELLRHVDIGSSVEGRALRVYVLSDPSTGTDQDKPLMWIDGNVHGNEVQGGEAVLYAAWYLLENRAEPQVKELLDGAVFHLMPLVNPDGRAHWFQRAHDSSSSRTGVQPTDEDRDGRLDEDPPNDLDGDGHITQMRKHVPGRGTHRQDPDDPRVLVPVPANDVGRRGDWVLLGEEGLDDDGDGRVNEDDVGGYDMNRAWPSLWEPEHVQRGAGPYPLYWPEARAIGEHLLGLSNLAGLQSFHNAGGMILRGPGAEPFGEYEREDVRVFDELGRSGERMLPFYRYMVIWKDLYTVWGGFATWGYEGLGVISFTNEMWNSEQLTGRPREGQAALGGPGGSQKERLALDDRLLFGAGFHDWKPYDHPLYGAIEIGGFRKDTGRVPPSFMIEEMVARNALFALEHARNMPAVVIDPPEVTDLGGGVKAVDVVFRNLRSIPTRTARAASKRIGSPDVFTIEGQGLSVLAGGFRRDRWRPEALELAEREPERLVSERGIGSRGELRVRWLVTGSARSAVVRCVAEKARDAQLTFDL